MKKVLFALLVSFILLFSFSCATTNDTEKVPDASNLDYTPPPDWFTDVGLLYKEYGMDVIVGIGTGQKVNLDLSRRSAEAGALRSISQQIDVKLEFMYKEFLEGKDYASDKDIKNTATVVKTISSRSIRGAKLMKQFISPSGYAYVAYIVDQQAALNNAIMNDYRDAERNYRDTERNYRDTERNYQLYADFVSELVISD